MRRPKVEPTFLKSQFLKCYRLLLCFCVLACCLPVCLLRVFFCLLLCQRFHFFALCTLFALFIFPSWCRYPHFFAAAQQGGGSILALGRKTTRIRRLQVKIGQVAG